MATDDVSLKSVAEPNTILRGLVGSSVHGLVLSGTDDRDEWASALSRAATSSGSASSSSGCIDPAAEREGRAGARSRAGELDLTIYSLRKWARLALQGNPTVLLLLYLPDDALVVRTEVGRQLQQLAPAFASRQAWVRARDPTRGARTGLTRSGR